MSLLRKLLPLTIVVLALIAPRPGMTQQLTIWHDKADPGIDIIRQIAALYQHEHQNVTITSLSIPTDQWLPRVVAALNTNTGPDILFNDNDRIIAVEKATQKLSDLAAAIGDLPAADRAQVLAGDIQASSFGGKVIQIPVQRVLVGLGARTSWLKEVNATFPKTWDDFIRIAGEFKAKHPDAWPMALHAGSPGSITSAGIDLFAYGNGAPHSLLDDKGNIVIEQPEVAQPLIGYLQLFTKYKYVSTEAVNYSFTDLYQMIEGGKVIAHPGSSMAS